MRTLPDPSKLDTNSEASLPVNSITSMKEIKTPTTLATISSSDGSALLILQPSTIKIEDGIGLLTQMPSTFIDLIGGQS